MDEKKKLSFSQFYKPKKDNWVIGKISSHVSKKKTRMRGINKGHRVRQILIQF